jgi:threonine dehydrogenase-like Zn-dependent dehydrogenase
MRALSYRGPRRLEVTDKPIPKIEHPNDAIVRVTRAAICGSDLHLYGGFVPDTRVGHTFGHEFTGVVVELGANVDNLELGDRVVVPFPISCGRCYFCDRGLFASCESTNPNHSLGCGVFGYSHLVGGYEGGQAEYVRVPFADVGPLKIPSDLSDEDVLFLSDIFPTGYQAAEMGEIKPGERVVIFGAGPVGLFAMKSAWWMGAGRVIVVDQEDYRLAFARRFANVETMNFREVDDIVAAIKRETDGRGADVCIDAVGMEASGSAMHKALSTAHLEGGNPLALNWAIESTRKGGNVSIIGVYGPPFVAAALGQAMNRGLTLRMNQCNVHRYLPHLLDHIRAGRVDPKAIISHRVPLEEAPEAYRMFAEKRDEVIKVVLVP